MGQRDPEVDAWFEAYDNPLREVVLAVREVVLAADDRIGETIKWQAPTFVYKGNLASFFPKAKTHVTLMFHRGAALEDPTGALEGDGGTARSLKVADLADLDGQAEALAGLVRSWIALRDAS